MAGAGRRFREKAIAAALAEMARLSSEMVEIGLQRRQAEQHGQPVDVADADAAAVLALLGGAFLFELPANRSSKMRLPVSKVRAGPVPFSATPAVP